MVVVVVGGGGGGGGDGGDGFLFLFVCLFSRISSCSGHGHVDSLSSDGEHEKVCS